MIDIDAWMELLLPSLRAHFGKRLLFVGLQGSYLRGEATETSDVDIVLILDTLSTQDMDSYRRILSTLPQHEKACGFVCGKAEMAHWPAHEIFQLAQDTQAYYGELAPLLPTYTQNDIRRSVHIAASAFYHSLCHEYIFASADSHPTALKSLYKAAFFMLQLVEYLRNGIYYHTKKALLPHLRGDEKHILALSMNQWDTSLPDINHHPQKYVEQLLQWCSALLTSF